MCAFSAGQRCLSLLFRKIPKREGYLQGWQSAHVKVRVGYWDIRQPVVDSEVKLVSTVE
jgi:hypothetical protein